MAVEQLLIPITVLMITSDQKLESWHLNVQKAANVLSKFDWDLNFYFYLYILYIYIKLQYIYIYIYIHKNLGVCICLYICIYNYVTIYVHIQWISEAKVLLSLLSIHVTSLIYARQPKITQHDTEKKALKKSTVKVIFFFSSCILMVNNAV